MATMIRAQLMNIIYTAHTLRRASNTTPAMATSTLRAIIALDPRLASTHGFISDSKTMGVNRRRMPRHINAARNTLPRPLSAESLDTIHRREAAAAIAMNGMMGSRYSVSLPLISEKIISEIKE